MLKILIKKIYSSAYFLSDSIMEKDTHERAIDGLWCITSLFCIAILMYFLGLLNTVSNTSIHLEKNALLYILLFTIVLLVRFFVVKTFGRQKPTKNESIWLILFVAALSIVSFVFSVSFYSSTT